MIRCVAAKTEAVFGTSAINHAVAHGHTGKPQQAGDVDGGFRALNEIRFHLVDLQAA